MSLTDIMSHSDLSIYPQVALIIFLVVFASMTIRIFTSRERRRTDALAASLPLNEAPVVQQPREASAP